MISFYYTHLGLLFTAPCGRFNIKPRARSMPGTAEGQKIWRLHKEEGSNIGVKILPEMLKNCLSNA